MVKKMRGLWIFILIIGMSSLQAQILNSDGFGQQVDSTRRLRSTIGLGLTISNPSNILMVFSANGEISYWFKDNVLISTSNFKFIQSQGENILNRGYTHLRLRILDSKRFHPEVFTQYQLDGRRGMEERFLAGGGMRMRIIGYDEGALFFGLGGMYEYEKWNNSGVVDTALISQPAPIINHLPKVSSYISYRQKIGESTSLNLVAYYQFPPNSNFMLPRISGVTDFNFKINKYLTFTCSFKLNYDAAPPVPVSKLYYTLNNTLNFTF